jgi:two-component system sensor histidine kinase KdpD
VQFGTTMNTKNTHDFLELLRQTNRGRLKIYIGSVAGVGKTYRMLQEAHDLKAREADIVVAFVETYDRPKTQALVPGLEVIPRKILNYRGLLIEEMDLDAILSRKPQIAIVDELAHTNAPLCKNSKRYQDVIELLMAGINVICAFNIQHLESLNDIIKNFTGVAVHETIPDTFLREADQVVNVDLAVEDIIERLQSGQIYPLEKAKLAIENFFIPENLSKLRELALIGVAEIIDQSSRMSQLKTSEGSEVYAKARLMVCFSPKKRSQKILLRKAFRIAGKLHTDWWVVYAQTAKDKPERIDSEKQRHLYEDLQFAKDLGASIVHLKTHSRIEAWVDFAHRQRISHLIINRDQAPWWQVIFGVTTLDKLLKMTPHFDVYVLNSHVAKKDELDL